MNIEKVTSEDLRRMENQEGLILQGCGGDLNEWVDGINQMLTANGCLREGTQFQKVSTFDQEGLTCLLFHFTDDVKVNGARLAMKAMLLYRPFLFKKEREIAYQNTHHPHRQQDHLAADHLRCVPQGIRRLHRNLWRLRRGHAGAGTLQV